MSKRAEAEARLAASIVDGRDPHSDVGSIMVTLEGVVAAILLLCMNRDPRKAAAFLNQGLVPRVERRLSLYARRQQTKAGD